MSSRPPNLPSAMIAKPRRSASGVRSAIAAASARSRESVGQLGQPGHHLFERKGAGQFADPQRRAPSRSARAAARSSRLRRRLHGAPLRAPREISCLQVVGDRRQFSNWWRRNGECARARPIASRSAAPPRVMLMSQLRSRSDHLAQQLKLLAPTYVSAMWRRLRKTMLAQKFTTTLCEGGTAHRPRRRRGCLAPCLPHERRNPLAQEIRGSARPPRLGAQSPRGILLTAQSSTSSMMLCSADWPSDSCSRREGSLPSVSRFSSATRPRATRLLIVPTAQPQISAASS